MRYTPETKSQRIAAAILALPAGANLVNDRPRDCGELNRWLAKWTTARISRHWAEDGSQCYWHSGTADSFYQQTVEQITRAYQLTFAEWLRDYEARLSAALDRAGLPGSDLARFNASFTKAEV